MVVSRVGDPELNDDLGAIGPPVHQGTTAAEYVSERTKLEDMDVIAGLKEIDGAEGVRWEISRVGSEDPNRDGHVASWPTEMLSTENIGRRFGPGTYKVFGRYPNGTYAASRRVKIAMDAAVIQRQGAANAPAAPAQAFDVQRFMMEQEAREEQRRERARRERNELLAILVPAISPIAAALLGNRGPDVATLAAALKPPAPPTMPEMMTALASLKALVPAPEPTADPVDRALKLLDFLQDKAPSGAGESNWFDLAKEALRSLGPTLGPVVAEKLTSMGTMPVGSPNGSNVLLPAPSQTSAPVASTENPQMLALLRLQPWLKTQLAMAIDKAARGSDPVVIALRIIDDIPDGIAPNTLVQFIVREDWFSILQQFDARVTPYEAWFTQMRQAMLEEFDAATQVQPPAPAMTVNTQPQEIDRPSGPPSLLGGE